MSLDLGELVASITVDTQKGQQSLSTFHKDLLRFADQADSAGTKAGQAFGDGLVSEAQQAGEEAGERAGEGLLTKSKLAAGAAGAAAALAFGEALDVDAGRDRLVAQLGLGPKASERAGRIAGDLYAHAYGDSMDHVNTAVASVMTSVEGMDKASGRRLEGLTAKALDFASAFEVDVVRATQVAGVMIDSKLAKNGTRAFDLLTKASQKVPVALREDLLDATEEYGQFFDTLGYDGKQAFSLLVDASAKGMYGIDKAGDAVKEFTIRATDMSVLSTGAYGTIGLNAEEMAKKILKGGDDAQEATQQVIDGLLAIENPATRANAAIALFGTPIEDLNVKDIPAFLRSLKGTSDAMDGVAGSAKRMGDGLNDNAATRFKQLKRTMEMDFVNFLADDVLPVVESEVLPALEDFGDWFTKDGKPALKEFKDALGPVVGMAADLVGWLNDLPKPAKYAGLVALLGGVGAMKVRGGNLGDAGLLGTVGKTLGLAKPVPVFVTNPGFDVPGAGTAGTKGGGWRGVLSMVPQVMLPALGALGNDTFKGDEVKLSDEDIRQLEKAGFVLREGVWVEANRVNRQFEELISNAGLFGDELDLVGGKKVHPDLTVPGPPQAHRDLQRFFELEIEAGRPITPYVSLTGVESAQQQIATLAASIHALPSLGDHSLPYLSGGGTSSQPGGSGGGGGGKDSGGDAKTPKTGGVQISIGKVMAHDYGDFMQQTQRRAQQAALGGY